MKNILLLFTFSLIGSCSILTPQEFGTSVTTPVFINITNIPEHLNGKKMYISLWVGENDIACGSGSALCTIRSADQLVNIYKYESALSTAEHPLALAFGTKVTFLAHIDMDDNSVIGNSGDLVYRSIEWIISPSDITYHIPIDYFTTLP